MLSVYHISPITFFLSLCQNENSGGWSRKLTKAFGNSEGAEGNQICGND